ncbi:hypothetical protein CK203_007014 [Vitis vinifera]|uniref:Disease resistance protein At4g27190-like leucine-rich repeats domain-containing protein n=1 Tax=Vitis vinifera TaxID=29760 RepID=A0A438KCG3_VITVI|nr:hypothetical protein CK203_007014 [Vitis vinifera]
MSRCVPKAISVDGVNLQVAFPNLEFLNLSLKLEKMKDLHVLFGALSNLKILIVENCPFLSKEVFDLKGLAHGDDEHVETLSKLEDVSLIDLPQLRDICNDSPLQVLCFQNLKSLEVKQCNSVMYLFSPSMVLGLVQLQDLHIEHCPALKEIFTVEGRDTDNWPPQVSCFQNLKSLQVKQCDSLMYLFPYSVALGLGQLQELCIDHCSKMKKIIMEDGDVDNRPQQVSSLHNLKFVRVKQCDSLMYLFSPSMALGLVQLQDLCIEHCPTMTEIVTGEDRDFDNQPPLVSCFQNLKSVQVKQCDSLMYLFSSSFALALVQLQDLCIEHCYTMKEIVREYRDVDSRHPQVSCFGNLKFIQVKRCDNLMYLFSSSFALALEQLQDLRIEHCDTMKEIVAAEKGVTDEIIFPQITRVSLLKLPKLTSFHLEKIHVGDSNKVPGVLFNEQVSFPSLVFLYVSGLDNVEKIWHNQLLANSFSKLKEMKEDVTDNRLSRLVLDDLQNLEHICDKHEKAFSPYTELEVVGEIIRQEEGAEEVIDKIDFPELTSLSLKSLPSLASFYPGSHTVLFNEKFLRIANCGQLKKVFDLGRAGILDNETATQLNKLELHNLPLLQYIWNKDPYGILTFQNLAFVEVFGCHGLESHFPADNLVRDLSQLEKQLIRSRWTKDLREKDKGEDFVFPEVTYDDPRKIKGKDVLESA